MIIISSNDDKISNFGMMVVITINIIMFTSQERLKEKYIWIQYFINILNSKILIEKITKSKFDELF